MAELKQIYKRIMDDHFPEEMTITFGDQRLVYRKRTWRIPDERTGELIDKGLRYGENPDQEAALYQLVNGNLTLGECTFIAPGRGLVSDLTEADLLQFGKHPGKINLTDIDNALNILKFLTEKPGAVIMKHNNPCGAAYGSTIAEAYEMANMADRIAAFGGCAAFNRTLDKTTAEMISQNYLEVVVAPEFGEGTIDILKKRRNLRIVRVKRIDRLREFQGMAFVDFKSLIDGGIIVQPSPLNRIRTPRDFLPAVATYQGKEYRVERPPTPQEEEDMLFGWSVEQGITSNSVIYVKNGVTVGIGTGEQDRV
jgi:phosphoribosylaminoimidazolecarboxamide formyltransferase/IMP cyclohydrolase